MNDNVIVLGNNIFSKNFKALCGFMAKDGLTPTKCRRVNQLWIIRYA